MRLACRDESPMAMSQKQLKEPMTAVQASRLLELLSTDDKFRSLFKERPAVALEQVGYSTRASDSGQPRLGSFDWIFCTLVGELASKEEFAAARDALQSYLTSTAAMTVIFAFESGQVEARVATI